MSTFRNVLAPNISQNKSGSNLVNDGFVVVYTATTASYVIQCDLACVHTSGVQASVRIKATGQQAVHLVKDAPIPVGSTLQIIDGQKLVLLPGDTLEVKCETPDVGLDAIVSLVENVNDY